MGQHYSEHQYDCFIPFTSYVKVKEGTDLSTSSCCHILLATQHIACQLSCLN